MNYSTLKKTVALSFVSLMAVGMVKAQTTTTDSSKMASGTTAAKVFGGTGQYNTWSIGLNLGATSPSVFTGGVNVFNHNKIELGYGLSVRDQLSHSLGLQLDVHGGKLAGSSTATSTNPAGYVIDTEGLGKATSFETSFWSGTLSGVYNFGNLSFLHRKSVVNFFVTGGLGLAWYTPKVTLINGTVFDYKGQTGDNHDGTYIKELVIPVGAGARFRLSEQLDLNVGYTENFTDGFNLTGVHASYPAQNRYSYGYAGLEYTFGPKSKPSLEWVNPVAMMYDELYDAALRQEVEALKGRVTNVENAVRDLKKDSDGDGVSDQFDKCPNTPAGTVVDGSGCPIIFPKPDTTAKAAAMAPAVAPYSNIQFEFDSSVLKTSSYPVLDATSSDLRSNSSTLTLAGYASSEGTRKLITCVYQETVLIQ